MTKYHPLVVGLLSVGMACAQAQTAPKPAGEGRTLSLGGSGTGKLMDRDELRACLKQQETLTARRAEVDQTREPMEREKTALATDQQALAAERERLEGVRRSAAELSTRFTAYAERVKAWNERAAAVKDKSGPLVDAERRQLDGERTQLQQEQVTLEAERTRLGESAQKAVDEFNGRAQALDARVTDWNRRNAELVTRADAVNREREQWVESCANRRYREDDEIAIRQGK